MAFWSRLRWHGGGKKPTTPAGDPNHTTRILAQADKIKKIQELEAAAAAIEPYMKNKIKVKAGDGMHPFSEGRPDWTAFPTTRIGGMMKWPETKCSPSLRLQ